MTQPAPEFCASLRPRLLVLDDDPVMREIIAVLAERQGFASRMAGNPAEFFSELERWKPTHVTIDLVMPTQDGIEVLRELASRACPAAIVIISSMDLKVLDSARRVASERGLQIVGVLAKPFKHDALRELLGLAMPAIGSARVAAEQATGMTVSRPIIEEALREAQFILHFQPKVSLTSGAVVGIEVLVRWQHPLLGLVMPDRFITELERNGSIGLLTQQVIADAMAWFAASGIGDRMTLAVNVSAHDLNSLVLADDLHRRCADLGIDPARVVLELTETGAMKYPETALATLTRLRIKGFGLSIDDFGTGYSSMVQLARLPFSSMKIDKSFVMSMCDSAESRKIVTSIISLGHSLGLSIVAEGVESIASARLLRAAGCDVAQGYEIAAPMDARALAAWLQAWDAQAFAAALDVAGPLDLAAMELMPCT